VVFFDALEIGVANPIDPTNIHVVLQIRKLNTPRDSVFPNPEEIGVIGFGGPVCERVDRFDD
jgi:hypothetical protein